MKVKIIARADGKNTHIHLMELMQSLGYGVAGGICYGIAMMALQAILQGEEAFNTFKARINRLNEYTSESLLEAMNTRKGDQELVDIRAFFDGVDVHMNAARRKEFFEKGNKPTRQDGVHTQSLISSLGLEGNSFAEIDSFLGFYSPEELESLFESLEESLDQHNSFKEPVFFLLESSGHAILLASIESKNDSDQRDWILVDANWLEFSDIYTSSYFSSSIGDSFNKGDVLFSVKMMGSKKHEEALKKIASSIHENKKFEIVDAVSSEKLKKRDKNDSSLIDLAIAKDQEKGLEKIVESGFYLTKCDRENCLFDAIRDGSMKVMEFLLEQKANVEYARENGETAIFHAITTNNIKALELLHKYKANIDHKDFSGYPPLVHAILLKKIEAIESLINLGANLESKNSYGETPIFSAIQCNQIEAIKIFLKKNVDLQCQNKFRKTPLLYAIDKKNVAAIDVLVNESLQSSTEINLFEFEKSINGVGVIIGFFKKIHFLKYMVNSFPVSNEEKDMCFSFLNDERDNFFHKNESVEDKKQASIKCERFIESVQALFFERISELLSDPCIHFMLKEQAEAIVNEIKHQLEDPCADHEKAIKIAVALFNVLASLSSKTENLDKQVVDLKCSVSQLGLFNPQKNFAQDLDNFCHLISQPVTGA